MADTTLELIDNAYYAAGIVSREFETVSAGQASVGLNLLNDIIGEKAVDEGMIPYESTYSLDAVIGQEEYFITDLVQVDTLTFFKDSVRYSMQHEKRNQYFGSTRVTTITSLPFEWYVEREFGGARLYIYFQPDQAYPMEIHGMFRLSEVTLNQDLSLTLDRFYRTYLRYALADRLCAEFQYTTPDNVLRQLGKYESFINKKSRVLDLRMTKQSTLQKSRAGVNWAYVNLSQGFTTP